MGSTRRPEFIEHGSWWAGSPPGRSASPDTRRRDGAVNSRHFSLLKAMPMPAPRAEQDAAFRARVAAVLGAVDIASVIGGMIPLGKGRNPRGKCPFHGSKSDSFAVDSNRQKARCWGCDWSGDAIKFVQDFEGLPFIEALRRLETGAGIGEVGGGERVAAVRREKRERPPSDAVSSTDMGRYLWRRAKPDLEAVRTWFRARGVPEAMLTDDRLTDVRFVPSGPIYAWPANRKATSVPQAPVMVALVRRPPDWTPTGVHATFLSPDLAGKMHRLRGDGSPYPARKMLGDMAGAAVLLGRYAPDLPLFVGEGLETVLCGMAIAGAGESAIGLAALSLSNLQGSALTIKGALPLYDPRPNPNGGQALTFPHSAPVTGLIDADMTPLPGRRDRVTGEHQGVALIERLRGPILHRTMTTQERASVGGALFVHAWRAQGCTARAVRPRMGMDFNDAVRGGL